jgi:hypothetical protein
MREARVTKIGPAFQPTLVQGAREWRTESRNQNRADNYFAGAFT